MSIQSTAGTTFAISAGTPATYDAAGYNALTWTLVGEITNLGEFGRAYTQIDHLPIGTRIKQKLKGSIDEGNLDLQLALDTDDAGQILMKTASTSDSAYSIRVIAQNGDKYFMRGLVMSFKRVFGGADDITGASCNIALTGTNTGVGVVEDLAA